MVKTAYEQTLEEVALTKPKLAVQPEQIGLVYDIPLCYKCREPIREQVFFEVSLEDRKSDLKLRIHISCYNLLE